MITGSHVAFMWRHPLKREEGKPIADRYRPCPCGGRRSRESRKFFLGPAWLRRASFTSMASSESERDSLYSPCRAMLAVPRKTLERALGTLAVAITLSRPSSSFSPTSATLRARQVCNILGAKPDSRAAYNHEIATVT